MSGTDVARTAGESRLLFLAELSEALRPIEEPAALVATALELLRRQLHADRCAWAEAEAEGECVAAVGCASAPGVPQITGRWPLSAFGVPEAAALRAGIPVRVADALDEPPDGASRAAYESTGIRSHVAVPLRREGRLVAVLGAHMLVPRRWTDDEVALASEVLARCAEAMERQRAERRLAQSEAQLRALVTAMDEAFALCEIVTDAQGRPVDILHLETNPKFEEMTGLHGAQGRTARELVPGVEPFWLETYARVAFDGQTRRFEAGSEALGRWWDIFATPVEPRGRFAIVFRDITARRRQEEERRRAVRNLRTFLVHAPANIAMFDRDMRYLAASRRWLEAYIPGARDVTGELHYEVMPFVPDHWRDAHARGLAGEVVVCDEESYVDQQGATHWMKWEVQPWLDESGAVGGIVIAVDDITARKLAEQRLALAQRMETAGRIAGGVAHEANNQMTVVLGTASFLLERADLPADVRQDLGEILGAAERTARVCRQLLAFSRRQVLHPELLDADAVVRRAAAMLEPTLGPTVRLEVAAGAPGVQVRVDGAQLEEAILNVALNARDAMPHGGTFRLTSAVVTLAAGEGPVHDGALRPGSYWQLALRDTGVGMDAATLARACDPFFTTKPLGRGTGLGLSMVQGLVRQSGGDLLLESAPGQGTTVRILLPLAHVPARTAPPAPAAPRPPRGAVIFLVEDEPVVRLVLSRALLEAGFEVRTAANGAEALEAMGESSTPPACLVTDIVMPRLSGTQLAEALRARWPDLPVILMSGHPDEASAGEGLLRDVPFLAKPFPPAELVRRVAAVVAARQGAG